MKLFRTTRFKRGFKKSVKQGQRLEDFERVLDLLLDERKLPARYRDHPLTGQWKNSRELHIKPDWLLIYRIEDDILYLEAIGSHADLLGM